MKLKSLKSTLLSVILLTSNLVSGTVNPCVDGKCFINLSYLSDSKETTRPTFKTVKNDQYNQDIIPPISVSDALLFEEEIYEPMAVIENEIETIVFTQETYIMNELEQEFYLLENLLTLPVEELQNEQLLELNPLPLSDFYCDNHTHPIYNIETDSFECA